MTRFKASRTPARRATRGAAGKAGASTSTGTRRRTTRVARKTSTPKSNSGSYDFAGLAEKLEALSLCWHLPAPDEPAQLVAPTPLEAEIVNSGGNALLQLLADGVTNRLRRAGVKRSHWIGYLVAKALINLALGIAQSDHIPREVITGIFAHALTEIELPYLRQVMAPLNHPRQRERN